jgi:hypothetical protein
MATWTCDGSGTHNCTCGHDRAAPPAPDAAGRRATWVTPGPGFGPYPARVEGRQAPDEPILASLSPAATARFAQDTQDAAIQTPRPTVTVHLDPASGWVEIRIPADDPCDGYTSQWQPPGPDGRHVFADWPTWTEAPNDIRQRP